MRSASVLHNVFNNYALELFDLIIVELFERYSKMDPQELIFDAPLGNIRDTYYDIPESVRILVELLHRQCRGNSEIVSCFLTDLLDVLEKQVAKKKHVYCAITVKWWKEFFFIYIALFIIS